MGFFVCFVLCGVWFFWLVWFGGFFNNFGLGDSLFFFFSFLMELGQRTLLTTHLKLDYLNFPLVLICLYPNITDLIQNRISYSKVLICRIKKFLWEGTLRRLDSIVKPLKIQ